MGTDQIQENSKSQMRKGILEFCILLVIQQKEKAYTNEILEELKKAKLLVVEGTVYPLLSRLKNTNLLNYSWEESQMGPPRKYYTLTTKGRAALKEYSANWHELIEAVKTLEK